MLAKSSYVSTSISAQASWRQRLLQPLAALLVLGCVACGAGAPPVPCQTAPQSCAAGTTCWPIDRVGTYQCLASKEYKPLGSDCSLLVGLTTCADGLICAPMLGKDSVKQSRCTSICDASHPCTDGAACTAVSLFPLAPEISVCILPPS